MGTNQYAQSDLFLYPLQTAKKNNPGINANCPKIWYRKKTIIAQSIARTKDVLLCRASIGFL